MIILEHEAKNLLAAAGLPIPPRAVVRTAADAQSAAEEIGGAVVLKGQVPTGGRMKAGGVVFASDAPQAATQAAGLLGMDLRGFRVGALLVEQKLNIAAEYFLAVTIDAETRQLLIIASAEGGIEIEAGKSSIQQHFSARLPFSDYQGRQIAARLGLAGRALVQFGGIITQLVACFRAWDALLLECNPVVLDADGKFWIADVHLELDDDALFRQKGCIAAAPESQSWAEHRSDFEQQALEIDRADHRGVAGRLVAFGGSMGMLIGGGGASLTAMDAVLDAGLKPANYCEIGGNPSVWKIKELTKLILSQAAVDELVVIMNVVSNTRVDLVARGVIKGVLEMGKTPREVIRAFRIPGSWEDEGYALLDHYGVRYFGRETSIDAVIAHLVEGNA